MTSAEVAAEAADAFAVRVHDVVEARHRFRCAVPGGSVATLVFPLLAAQVLPWDRVDLFLADERLVSPDHPDSNQRVVRALWLDRLPGPRPMFYPPPTLNLTAEEAARSACRTLRAVAGTPPRLDLVILGVGPDGHVASLFPASVEWRHSPDYVIAVHDAPKPPPVRISMGLATLAAAHEMWFVAFGQDKAAAIAEARSPGPSPLPVAVVAASGPRVRWFLDEAASAL